MTDHRLAPHVTKRFAYTRHATHLQFDVAQGLFSSHHVDTGSRHLLKSLQGLRLPPSSRILDLGCGYGPLGIALAKDMPEVTVHLVDRDALAVAFAHHNARLNQIADAHAYGSLGYDDLQRHDFNLIVSNIPGKAGEPVIQAFLLGAYRHLATDGFVAVVVVAPLEPLVQEILEGPGIEILTHHGTAGHVVFHYRFTSDYIEPGIPMTWSDGTYDRLEVTFLLDEATLPMRTVRGLPEFDSLSYDTVLAYKAMWDLEGEGVQTVCAFTPGQGILPALLWRQFAPKRMVIVARDLLALRTAGLNLVDNGCPTDAISLHHSIELVPARTKAEVTVGKLRDDESTEAIEQAVLSAAARLDVGSQALVVGGSTPITRLLKSYALDEQWRLKKRRRAKGNSTALLVKR